MWGLAAVDAEATPAPETNMVPPTMAVRMPTAIFLMRVLIPLPVLTSERGLGVPRSLYYFEARDREKVGPKFRKKFDQGLTRTYAEKKWDLGHVIDYALAP
ncbi:hypothetical protein GCM10020001_064800 [Nonomuraea salmonea]